MKKNKIFSILLITLFCSLNSYAQKIKVISGDLSMLTDQESINVVYKYDGMKVGKNKTEEQYTGEKVAEHNKKEPGKGDQWLQKWKAARKDRYEPKFEELINKELEKKSVVVKSDNKARYTIIVVTTRTEPGFNIGITKMPAGADYEFNIVETAKPDKVLSKLILINVPGSQPMGYDFDAGTRISECYAKAGKTLGKFLASKVYKAKK